MADLEYLSNDPAWGHVLFRVQRLGDDSPADGVVLVIEMPDGSLIRKTADAQGVVRIRATAGDKFKLVKVIDDKQQNQLTSVGKIIST